MKSIQVEIDAKLAEAYRRRYLKAFPSEITERMAIQQFISNFLEDRLREEIVFIERELQAH